MLTTAFTSTTIAFDSDTNPTKRSHTLSFYGYVPDGNKARLKVFLFMVLIKIAHVMSTSMGLAFLFAISLSSAYAYLAVSMGVFLLYRACRCDLHYWLPVEGKTGWFASIVARVFVKIVVDFTGCIQFRHPNDLGGLYYSLTLLQAQVGSAVFAKMYIDASEGDADSLVSRDGLCGRHDRVDDVGVQLLAVPRAHQERLCGHVYRHAVRHPVHRGPIQRSQGQRSSKGRGSREHAQVLEKHRGRVAQVPGGEVDSVGRREADVLHQDLDR